MRRARSRSLRAAPALALVVACACGPRDAPGGLPVGALGHTVPELEAASYAFTDTTRLTISAGAMGDVEVVRAQAGRVNVVYEAEADDEGLDVVVRLTEYEGRAENPRQGSATAELSDIDGEWRLRLDSRGLVAVVERPDPDPGARALALPGLGALPPQLFVALPGAPALPGATWVDTVRVEERAGELETRAVAAVTYTLVGDTVAAGRRALLIRTVTVTQSETVGTSGGVEIRERLAGVLTGRVLWDEDWQVMLARDEAGDLTGTLELVGRGAGPLPVVARRARSVRLVN